MKALSFARQTITTKYLDPTNTKGSRISAVTSSGIRIYRDVDNELNIDENHYKIAKTLRDEMGWEGEMVIGATKTGYVCVFADGPTI